MNLTTTCDELVHEYFLFFSCFSLVFLLFFSCFSLVSHTVPIDYIAGLALTSNGVSSSSLDESLRALKLIRGLRLLRLLKLARLFKLKKLGALLDDSDFYHPAMIKVLAMLSKIIFVAHLLSWCVL